MGKRYKAILKYLDQTFYCRDLNKWEVSDEQIKEKVDGIIIATPTETHPHYIRKCLSFKKPILCEKPITKNITQLKELFKEIGDAPFRMMNQYKLLCEDRKGMSFYDYYKHGNDGLVWDCLQVIGLARGDINLAGESPVWDCTINDKRIQSGYMDQAYVNYVVDWFMEPKQDSSELLEAHIKTDELKRSGRFG